MSNGSVKLQVNSKLYNNNKFRIGLIRLKYGKYKLYTEAFGENDRNEWLAEWLENGNFLGNPISPRSFVEKTQGEYKKRFRDPEADIILIEYLVTGVPIKTSSSKRLGV